MTEAAEQPDLGFDLDAMLSSLVSVRSLVPDDALTAPVLGTERSGNGVVIGDRGLVLTIGYLVTEAQTLWITDRRGAAVPGHVLGYDQESGFGLVQALQTASRAGHRARSERRMRRGRSGPRRRARRGRCDHHRAHHREAGVRGLLGVRTRRSPVHRAGAPELGRRRARGAGRPAARRRLAARADRLVERRAIGRKHDRADRSAQADSGGYEGIRPAQPAGAAVARLPRPGRRRSSGGGQRLRRLSGGSGRGGGRRSGGPRSRASPSTGLRSCSARSGASGRPGAPSPSPSSGTASLAR